MNFVAGFSPWPKPENWERCFCSIQPDFIALPRTRKKSRGRLQVFYDYPKVVELRHSSWDEKSPEIRALLEGNRASGVIIDEPKFASSIRQDFAPIGEIFYFRAHGRNAKAWWRPKESWERYDYCYSREEIKKIAERIKGATSTPGIKKGFAFFNNHARANAPANAIMLSQELGLRLKAMPSEAMLAKFPQLVNVDFIDSAEVTSGGAFWGCPVGKRPRHTISPRQAIEIHS